MNCKKARKVRKKGDVDRKQRSHGVGGTDVTARKREEKECEKCGARGKGSFSSSHRVDGTMSARQESHQQQRKEELHQHTPLYALFFVGWASFFFFLLRVRVHGWCVCVERW